MLTKEQKSEIYRLRDMGLNVSKIAKQLNLDWKTVNRCISLRSQEKIGFPAGGNTHPDENELIKLIFRKLNAGISPGKIVEEFGHVDLVASLYQKKRTLKGMDKSDSSLPDPKMVESFETWEHSFEKYQDWHLGRAIKAVGEGAYQKMILCANFKNKGVECFQIAGDDPYKCVGCQCYSGGDGL